MIDLIIKPHTNKITNNKITNNKIINNKIISNKNTNNKITNNKIILRATTIINIRNHFLNKIIMSNNIQIHSSIVAVKIKMNIKNQSEKKRLNLLAIHNII